MLPWLHLGSTRLFFITEVCIEVARETFFFFSSFFKLRDALLATMSKLTALGSDMTSNDLGFLVRHAPPPLEGKEKKERDR